MWHQVKQYFNFLIKSTNQHGVHSPFVFNLVRKCFYNRTDYPSYKILKNYRNDLLNNESVLTVKDFGAGSRVFKSNTRNVSQIAKNAGITKKRAQLLYRITQYFKPNSILELGTSLGLATSAMSLGNPEGKIVSIEGCPETTLIAKQQFDRYHLNNIDIRTNEFSKALKKLKSNKFDLIYIDGDHQKESTLYYFNSLMNHIKNDSLMIFDDIYWSKGMAEAWETIKQHEMVSVTIDTFNWGLVFFRKEQAKQHFTIRV